MRHTGIKTETTTAQEIKTYENIGTDEFPLGVFTFPVYLVLRK